MGKLVADPATPTLKHPTAVPSLKKLFAYRVADVIVSHINSQHFFWPVADLPPVKTERAE